jgi:hypothetical protein
MTTLAPRVCRDIKGSQMLSKLLFRDINPHSTRSQAHLVARMCVKTSPMIRPKPPCLVADHLSVQEAYQAKYLVAHRKIPSVLCRPVH